MVVWMVVERQGQVLDNRREQQRQQEHTEIHDAVVR